MVIVKLSSGLGNQLFMYAFLSYLQQENKGLPIFFETQSFGFDLSGRQSEIEIVYPNYPTNNGVFLISQTNNRYLRKLKELILVYASDIFVMDDKNCELRDYQLIKSKNYYFRGFWQTTYFVDRLIGKERLFKPKQPMPDSIINYYDQIIVAGSSACLHVRRGDYFSALYVNRYGVCNKEYYETAIDTLISKTKITHIFVFSDDLDWVMDNIDFPKNIFIVQIRNYPVNSFWYIYLMSLCHHNIISNSSFSWWGAYLNANRDKVVVCPKRWRLDTDENLALDSWFKINT